MIPSFAIRRAPRLFSLLAITLSVTFSCVTRAQSTLDLNVPRAPQLGAQAYTHRIAAKLLDEARDLERFSHARSKPSGDDDLASDLFNTVARAQIGWRRGAAALLSPGLFSDQLHDRRLTAIANLAGLTLAQAKTPLDDVLGQIAELTASKKRVQAKDYLELFQTRVMELSADDTLSSVTSMTELQQLLTYTFGPMHSALSLLDDGRDGVSLPSAWPIDQVLTAETLKIELTALAQQLEQMPSISSAEARASIQRQVTALESQWTEPGLRPWVGRRMHALSQFLTFALTVQNAVSNPDTGGRGWLNDVSKTHDDALLTQVLTELERTPLTEPNNRSLRVIRSLTATLTLANELARFGERSGMQALRQFSRFLAERYGSLKSEESIAVLDQDAKYLTTVREVLGRMIMFRKIRKSSGSFNLRRTDQILGKRFLNQEAKLVRLLFTSDAQNIILNGRRGDPGLQTALTSQLDTLTDRLLLRRADDWLDHLIMFAPPHERALRPFLTKQISLLENPLTRPSAAALLRRLDEDVQRFNRIAAKSERSNTADGLDEVSQLLPTHLENLHRRWAKDWAEQLRGNEVSGEYSQKLLALEQFVNLVESHQAATAPRATNEILNHWAAWEWPPTSSVYRDHADKAAQDLDWRITFRNRSRQPLAIDLDNLGELRRQSALMRIFANVARQTITEDPARQMTSPGPAVAAVAQLVLPPMPADSSILVVFRAELAELCLLVFELSEPHSKRSERTSKELGAYFEYFSRMLADDLDRFEAS